MIQRAASHAFGNTALSAIGLSVAKHAVGHPGLTGVALVEDGIDAFAIRSRLIAAAERSIDLQYYIWRDDRKRPADAVVGNRQLSACVLGLPYDRLWVDG
jgi:phosphatidylserine/phosphatidylglycerophosphate/cardiolipin synthase-like enzyme